MKRALIGITAAAVALAVFHMFRGPGAPPPGADRSAEEPEPPPAATVPGVLHAGAARSPGATAFAAAAMDTGVDPEDDEEDASPVEEARRARAAVISAIRAKHPSPEARRAAMRSALRASGPFRSAWTAQAEGVFTAWSDALPPEARHVVDRSSIACFRAGCEVRVTFPDRASEAAASAAFRSIREDGAPHGGRVLTPHEPGADGGVEVSWIMMAPIEEESP